jgi:hypothetical protein
LKRSQCDVVATAKYTIPAMMTAVMLENFTTRFGNPATVRMNRNRPTTKTARINHLIEGR